MEDFEYSMVSTGALPMMRLSFENVPLEEQSFGASPNKLESSLFHFGETDVQNERTVGEAGVPDEMVVDGQVGAGKEMAMAVCPEYVQERTVGEAGVPDEWWLMVKLKQGKVMAMAVCSEDAVDGSMPVQRSQENGNGAKLWSRRAMMGRDWRKPW